MRIFGYSFDNDQSVNNNNDNNNIINSSSSNSGTWIQYRDEGKDHYEKRNYEEALKCWKSALSIELECPNAERQILLSNIVACRLKIGGRNMIEDAIQDAKECINLNDRWSKGHVRLASAYIALGGHSNDACNSLQRALNIDPGNSTARQMLTSELRRDRVGAATTTSSSTTTAPNVAPASASASVSQNDPEPSAPPAEYLDDPDIDLTNPPSSPPAYSYQNQYSQQQQQHQTQNDPNIHVNHIPPNNNTNDLDYITWRERVQFYAARASSWYEHNLSDESKTLLKILLALLILYVALGGRFGLNHTLGHRHSDLRYGGRGNYGHGNAYDRYRGHSHTAAEGYSDTRYGTNTGDTYHGYHTEGGNSKRNRDYSTSHGRSRQFYDDDYDAHHKYSNYYTTSSSSSSRSLFDGSIISMLVLLIFSLICHQLGINPFHAIMMMNMVGRRRGGMNMMGMGLGGMGYNQFMFGRGGFGGGFRPGARFQMNFGRGGYHGNRGRWF